MSEIVQFNGPENLERAASDYQWSLDKFLEQVKIAPEFLAMPDHMMLKANSNGDLEEKCREISPWSETDNKRGKVAFIEDWFMVAAKLLSPLALPNGRYCDWVEIRVSDGELTHPGMEYASYHVANLERVQKHLEDIDLDSEPFYEQHYDWRWLKININDYGQELRFSNKPLSEIIDAELRDGTARLI